MVDTTEISQESFADWTKCTPKLIISGRKELGFLYTRKDVAVNEYNKQTAFVY